MWAAAQAHRLCPVRRSEFIKNLERSVEEHDYPPIDVFICTADPYKEPPMSLVNTALSIMAYNYPMQKVSVYVSDDGGSQITLFALMEAAEFARYWLPFCRQKDILDRSPEVNFKAFNNIWCPETQEIKVRYETMKDTIEKVVQRGKVEDEHLNCPQAGQVFDKWTENFTSHDHPTIIEVLLETQNDEDMSGKTMPNLVYVSREKRKNSPHHFKAGALNVLLRVSAAMTNAPIVLTLDCDMYSNDPRTLKRVLCYYFDPEIRPTLGFIQFPQHFQGVNKHDTYGCKYMRNFHFMSMGMDGLAGPDYAGTGCFFCRRALFGGPTSFVSPETQELGPYHDVNKLIRSLTVLELAHQVAGSAYENRTKWGSQIGFRYGSLVEDTKTGYQLHCQGWKSVLCHPERAAFLGDIPITLSDVLTQTKRWSVGLLQMAFSSYSPLTYGTQALGPLMGLCYCNYAFWALWSIPITVYAFLPQLALLQDLSIFPKLSDRRFLLYAFLILSTYGQDFLELISAGCTIKQWWNDQRMWMIRGVSCYLFGFVDYLCKTLNISIHEFNVTTKLLDHGQSKRYSQGIFEFGAFCPMFVPIAVAAITNFISLAYGATQVHNWESIEEMCIQLSIAGFKVVNCWPIYEAMFLRSDHGRMHRQVTLVSVILTWALYAAFPLIPV